jgi:ectoine hydroxylase-related dioxygenase (phytanoyl-CoA dioxygenase family)
MFDAIENVRNYLADGVECISKAFANSIDVSKLKYKILNTIIDNIDSGNDEYDASYYKLLVEKTIQKIRIPNISFQSSKFENMISSQFNGEIKGNSMKSSLRTTLSETIYAVGEQMCSTLETSVEEFKANIENIKKDFLEQLLGDINNELETVSEQFDNKEQEIARYNELIDKIRRLDLENI